MSADPRQRLVVAHSVDPAAAEHEVQGNLGSCRDKGKIHSFGM